MKKNNIFENVDLEKDINYEYSYDNPYDNDQEDLDNLFYDYEENPLDPEEEVVYEYSD